MKDLDFDELDKAVSSLMSNKSNSPEESSSSESDAVVNISTTASGASNSNPAPTPRLSVGASAPESVARSTERINSSPRNFAATRKGGRFMDVLHPSSDMTTSHTATSRPSRERRSVESVSSNLGKSSSESLSESTAVDDPASEGVPEKTATSGSDWLDPIDVSSQPSNESTTKGPQANNADSFSATNPSDDDIAKQLGAAPPQSDPEPLDSPFLPDTKVAKRPLGKVDAADRALKPVNDVVDTGKQSPVSYGGDPEKQLPFKPEEEFGLPEELNSDLMAIESGEALPDVEPATQRQSPARVASSSPSTEKKSFFETKTAPLPAVAPASLPGAQSQVGEPEKNDADTNSGSVYDTEEYHKPLSHSSKKPSGWLWVLWIILILLLGAGAGALVYFVVL